MKNAIISKDSRSPGLLPGVMLAGWLATLAGFAQTTPVGGIARDFTIVNRQTQQPLRLSDYRGTVVLLDFFAWWCGPCNTSSPDVEQNINRYYRARSGNRYGVPITVISVNIEDSEPAKTDTFVSSYGLELVADDFSNVAYGQFGQGYIPHFVVINGVTNSQSHRAWEVLYSTSGYSRTAITNAIEQIKGPPLGVAPVITNQPADLTVNTGDSVQFSVGASGTPAPAFAWYFNGTPLAGETNSLYSIASVSPSQAGQYYARVYNSDGAVTSRIASLTVRLPGAPAITNQPANQTVVLGENAGFTVGATGNPELNYQWWHNGSAISAATGASLSLIQVSNGNAGPYFVTVSNSIATATSQVAQLTVVAPQAPAITTHPASLTNFEGEAAVFTSAASGLPAPAWQWLFNGAPLPNQTNAQCLLSQLATNHAGQYTAIAYNSAGSATSRVATLTILPHDRTPGGVDVGFRLASGAPNWNDGSYVNALQIQPDGKVLLAGNFYCSFDGYTRWGIMRLNAAGSMDTNFAPNPGANGGVNAMVLQPDGKVLIGGNFDTVNNVGRTRLARLNANGSLDNGFGASFYGGNVHCLALQPDGKVLVGGSFTNASGAFRPRVARLLSSGTVDVSFNPLNGANNTVLCLALQEDGGILVGGAFTAFNGTPRAGVARLQTNGVLDANFIAAFSSLTSVDTMALQPDGKIVLGGNFQVDLNGMMQKNLVRLNPDGSVDATFNAGTGPSHPVKAVALQPDGRLLVAGQFMGCNGILVPPIVRLHENGALDCSFGMQVQLKTLLTNNTGYIQGVAVQPNGEIFVGGRFCEVNGSSRCGFVRLHGNAAGRPVMRQARVQSDGKFSFALAGQPGKTYAIQTSRSLGSGAWNAYTNLVCTNILIDISEAPAPGVDMKFYRITE